MDASQMSNEELEREIRSVRSQRDFARLSVQLIETSLQRAEGMITDGLQGFEEHVPEPGPNPHRFIGYYKYDKEAYVRAYEGLKPMRDLVRLLNTFLPNMRIIRDGHQARFQELIGQQEIRQLRARMEAELRVENQEGNPGGDENGAVEANADVNPPVDNDEQAGDGNGCGNCGY